MIVARFGDRRDKHSEMERERASRLLRQITQRQSTHRRYGNLSTHIDAVSTYLKKKNITTHLHAQGALHVKAMRIYGY